MKILVLNGSPKREKSDTMHITSAFLDGMNKAADNDITTIHVVDKHIEYCTGCFKCKRNGGTCIHNDDMGEILEEILKTDILLFNFPLYCYGMPAPLKALIDRTMPLSSMKMRRNGDRYEHVEQADFSAIRYVMICGCGFPNSEHNFEGMETQFKFMFGEDSMILTIPESPMFNAPEARSVTEPFLETVTTAGYEYAENGYISDKTFAKLAVPMMPDDVYAGICNGEWRNHMDNKASITALMSAFGRAYHTKNEACPVFRDEFVEKLMTEAEYQMIAGYILSGIDFFAPEKKESFNDSGETLRYLVNEHIAPTPLCRAAFCEKSLETAVMTGTQQYVILGAGLDTFAFRRPEFMSSHKVYEVDHPKTQCDKLERIKAAGLEMPDNLIFVPVDFTTDNLKEKLLESGFDSTKKTFFSWLGVSYYLYRDDIEKMLSCISELSSEGSTLLFDYADAGLFSAQEKRVQNMLAMAKAGGEEMKASFDYLSLDSMLSDYGFLVYEILEPKDIQKQIIDPTGAPIRAFEHINYVQAVLKNK